jgi:hypothetical protein
VSPERQSTKHGPQIDDALAHEVEPLTEGAPVDGRAQESREPEPSGDYEPDPARINDGEINERSELARHLSPSWFPADREALLEAAIAETVPVPVIDLLQGLPEHEVFENPARAWEAMTGHREHRTASNGEEG